MNTIMPVSELKNDFEIYRKLIEAERNEEKNHKYYTIDNAWEAMTKAINGDNSQQRNLSNILE